MSDNLYIRPMSERDVPKLIDIRPGFETKRILRVEKTGEAWNIGWQLVEVELDEPYNKGRGYDFDATERSNILQRLQDGKNLLEVVVEEDTERVVGVLDVERRDWNDTAWIWNIMLDEDIRGRSIGTTLINHTMTWAKAQNLRAIMLETQTNNLPACHFYHKLGFELIGINEVFYSNNDINNDEVAIFWSYPLK